MVYNIRRNILLWWFGGSTVYSIIFYLMIAAGVSILRQDLNLIQFTITVAGIVAMFIIYFYFIILNAHETNIQLREARNV